MIDIVEAKNWDLNHLNINGSTEFKDEMQKQIQERLDEKNQVDVQIEDEDDDKFLDGLDKLDSDIKTLNEKITSYAKFKKTNDKANPKYTNDDIKENSDENTKTKKDKYR